MDLAADGLWRDEWWDDPVHADVEPLARESAVRRARHQRFGRNVRLQEQVSQAAVMSSGWPGRRRISSVASAASWQRISSARGAHWRRASTTCPKRALAAILSSSIGRRCVSWTIRRAKAETVGTEIADITVCGAIAPYTHLLGGKLVASLLASPTVVRAYHEKYREKPSEIASSIAGRSVVRPANLVYLGTTSLYGAGSSQYNRIKIPADVLDSSSDLKFVALGRSRSFGTSHLSQEGGAGARRPR